MANKITGRFDDVVKTLGKNKYITAYKPTNENWFPSYGALDSGDQSYLLSVSLIALNDGLFRVCVWGADDFGMELDQVSRKKAIKLYISLMLMTTIRKSDLAEMGFSYA